MHAEDASGGQAVAALERFKIVETTPPPSSSVRTAPLPVLNLEKHDEEKTVLYLAYGSNLAYSTFQGTRGIKPLSATNVLVPSLELAFDLPGVAYLEPCFANSRYRQSDTSVPTSYNEKDALLRGRPLGGHENDVSTASNLEWVKGMVGVVYEVTASDYAHIIATEGGGTTYADIEVDCYPLARGVETIPAQPEGSSFRVHTLFASDGNPECHNKRRPGWAQASERYLGLLRTGAEEHQLPEEYKAWLAGLQAYRITTWRQTMGKMVFVALWWPLLFAIFGLKKVVADKKGRAPKWLRMMTLLVFRAVWGSYDNGFKRIFGEGERTLGT